MQDQLQKEADQDEEMYEKLGCWCAPLNCHGNVLQDMLCLEIYSQDQDSNSTSISNPEALERFAEKFSKTVEISGMIFPALNEFNRLFSV